MHSLKLLSCLVIIVLLAAGCNTPTPQATPAAPTGAPVDSTAPPTPTQAPTPTETTSDTLVICLADEPATLYPYGGAGRSMWSVLEAIYDGPFDTRAYGLQPVILQKIPNLADGDALFQPVAVRAGDAVVDATGNLVTLEAGVQILPSGCTGLDCAITYDGASDVQIDQLVVTFKLLPGLKWSDGAALTAGDSVFSYILAADPATPTAKYLIDRTYAYKSIDEITVQWTGLPGFYEQRYGSFFWLPMPEHAWGEMGAADLLGNEAVNRAPLGWGPYQIQEWVAGDHITLVKNLSYHRAGEGLPYFERLVYRFIGEPGDSSLAALQTGECDVVDVNDQFQPMFPGLLDRENAGSLLTYSGQGPEWEHLDFGIRPAAYDDGYDPAAGDRPDIFGDARTRQAVAYCLDRQGIVDELLYQRSLVPQTYLPADHPLAALDLPAYPYDPATGMRLLDEVGWKDADGDSNTPRVASGVSGVPDGTALTAVYRTSQAALRRQVAERAAKSLVACGIGITSELLSPGNLFGPGPEGLVFGRKFDLIQFSWEASARPNCLLYTSQQIPSEDNRWVGANVSGYGSAAFDNACTAAYHARADNPAFAELNRQAQEQFARDLPVIPLYGHLKISISRPDFCGLELDVTARSIFWNLESYNLGSGCVR